MLLIYCEINPMLLWIENCVILNTKWATLFGITGTKTYVLFVTYQFNIIQNYYKN